MDLSQINVNNLRIVHYPDSILQQNAQPVQDFGPVLSAIADRMIDIMIEENGVGLAAPQVGLSLRLVTITLTGKREDAEVYVNPELSNFQGVAEIEEGCLSVPGVRAKVRRAGACTMDAQDLDGNHFSADAVDFGAIVIQHETDHLNGVLFVDRLNTIGRLAVRRGLKHLEQAATR